jgi:4a-hydroxytetrahydrobiopterin dehydratase
MKSTTAQERPLADKKCEPCRGDRKPMKGAELRGFLDRLGGDWELVEERQIEKEFKFNDWAEAQAFTNTIGDIAQEEDHHPDVLLSWGKVKVTLSTHKIGGLSENDFILAAKIDRAYGRR